jgi:hypothetical protein
MIFTYRSQKGIGLLYIFVDYSLIDHKKKYFYDIYLLIFHL